MFMKLVAMMSENGASIGLRLKDVTQHAVSVVSEKMRVALERKNGEGGLTGPGYSRIELSTVAGVIAYLSERTGIPKRVLYDVLDNDEFYCFPALNGLPRNVPDLLFSYRDTLGSVQSIRMVCEIYRRYFTLIRKDLFYGRSYRECSDITRKELIAIKRVYKKLDGLEHEGAAGAVQALGDGLWSYVNSDCSVKVLTAALLDVLKIYEDDRHLRTEDSLSGLRLDL